MVLKCILKKMENLETKIQRGNFAGAERRCLMLLFIVVVLAIVAG